MYRNISSLQDKTTDFHYFAFFTATNMYEILKLAYCTFLSYDTKEKQEFEFKKIK